MSLQAIFKSPFKLTDVEESDIDIEYPHVRFEYELKKL